MLVYGSMSLLSLQGYNLLQYFFDAFIIILIIIIIIIIIIN